MKKHHLLLAALFCLFLSSTAWAKWPIQSPKLHPSLANLTGLLHQAKLHTARLSQTGFPDSAVIFSWDNNSWMQDNNVGIRYQNGRVSRLIFYISGLPVLNYNYTYNASGKATLIEMIMTIPGQQPQVMTRFAMNYDANGNQTSSVTFEQQNGFLVQTSGDSLAITYSNGQPTEAIQRIYDSQSATPRWVNSQRSSGFVFNNLGQVTAVVLTPWDSTTNAWLTAEDTRYSNVVWNFGYAGFSTLFGGLVDFSQFLFTELPFAENDYTMAPTDYIEESRSGGNFVNNARLTSTLTNGRVSQFLEQNWENNAWVDQFRVIFTYSGSNMTLALNEANSNGNWVPEFRESWIYDASNNLTESKQESHNGTGWETMSGERHIFDYTSDNRVFRWVNQSWDFMTSQFVNTEKREYYFGGLPLNNAEIAKRSQLMRVFPNPTSGMLKLTFKELAASTVKVLVIDMNGKLIFEESFEPHADGYSLDLSRIANGVYRVVASTDGIRIEQSLVKY